MRHTAGRSVPTGVEWGASINLSRAYVVQMTLSRPLLAIVAAAVLASAPTAFAAPAPAAIDAADINAGLQAIRDYNVITLKDFGATNNVEGRAFVGGNVTSQANYFTNPKGQTGTALTVVGDLKKGANINNSGGMSVGGNVEKGANVNGSGAVVRVDGNATKINANGSAVYVDGNVSQINAKDIYYGGTIDKNSHAVLHGNDHTVSGLQAELKLQAEAFDIVLHSTSDHLASLEATNLVSYSSDKQKAIFDAGTGSGVAVFSLANIADALKGRSVLQFATPVGYDAVIINVAGSNITLPGSINFNGPSGLGANVIWNFYEATSLNFSGKAWYGSILAPDAALSNYNFIEGSVAVNSITTGGALRMNNFASKLAVTQIEEIQAAVPEPSTWAMMIMGFGAIGAVIRHRRRALAA